MRKIEILTMTDNSNAPALEKGNIIFVGKTSEYTGAGFYAIKTPSGSEIVRAHMHIDGKMSLTQDDVKSFHTKMTANEFSKRCVGKVLWVCKQADFTMTEAHELLMDVFVYMNGMNDKEFQTLAA